jgi:TolA-binding protein
MKRVMLIIAAAAVLATAGCSGEKGKEQFDTAQFEEKQNNKEHAIQLYEEIVKKYPDSPIAKKAGERLSVLKGSK